MAEKTLEPKMEGAYYQLKREYAVKIFTWLTGATDLNSNAFPTYTGNKLVGSANDATVGTHPLRSRGQFPIHLSHSGQGPVGSSQGSRSLSLRL